jgi:hypothetical protein
VWGILQATDSVDAGVAPDGTTTAEKVVPDATSSNVHGHYQLSVPVANGTAHAYSIYAKAAGYGGLQIIALGASASSWGATFNLDTGAVVGKAGSVTSQSIQALANGWYRCTSIVTSDSTSADVRLYLGPSANMVNDGTINSFSGDTTSGVLLWGFQVEAGAFATSYIPTTSASVTRAADAVSFSTLAWLTQGIGTGYAEFQTFIDAIGGIWGLEQTSAPTSEFIAAYTNTSNVVTGKVHSVSAGDDAEVSLTASPALAGRTAKHALAWATNSVNIALDGVAGTQDTSITPPTTIDRARLGTNDWANPSKALYIRRFAYWSSRLSNGVLQTLTT